MNRKWFGIGLILLGIILIGLFVYFFFVKPIRNGNPPGGGSLPEVPFGQGGVNQPDDDTIGSGGDDVIIGPGGSILEPEEERQLLFQITDFPITGYGTGVHQKEILDTVVRLVDVENPDGTVTTEEYEEEIITVQDFPTVRYHDKDGGLIFETIIDNGLEEQALIDNPINGMYESVFAGDNRVFMRYFDANAFTIKTYRGTLSSSIARAVCPHDFTTSYELGDTGRDIELIQSYIRQVIVPTQPLAPGVFDEAMVAAVRDFQEERGIQVDGIVRTQTNGQLQEVCLQTEQRRLEQEIAQSNEAPFNFSGVFIDDDIQQLAVSPSGEELFRLIDVPNTAWGVISNLVGDGSERIYDFDFRDWIIEWVGDTTLSFTTKASGLVTGSAYIYDLEAKNLFNVLKGYNGLTTRTSPDGSKMLYAYAVGQTSNQFGAVSVNDRVLRPLPVQTLPEKCVWSQDNITIYCMVPQQMVSALYPDRWYQGEIVFDDTLWRINTDTGTTAIIETFSEVPFDVDGVKLQLNADESFVFIIDQRTGYLWARDLVNER